MTKIYLSNIKLSKNNTTSIPKINMEGMFFGVGESIYVSNYKPAETLANAALTLPIQSTQPVAISGSNGSFTFSTVTFGNLNGVSFYTSNGSVVGSYTVPSVAGLLSNINVSAGSTSSNISALTFNNGNGVSFGFDGTNVTASVVPQSVQTQNLIDVTLGGNTSGTLALVSSGTLLFAGGNNITLSQVGNAVTISGANAAGAQTGISGVQVSNTTYTSGTITFQNANGISFGSSGANGISASYTVPTQSAQPVAISGSNGSFTFSTVTLGNLNGLSFYTSNGSVVGSYTVPTQTAQTGISGVQVSNTTYTSGTITFQNANGISFGSSGANGISASYTVPSTANLISRLAVSAGAGTSNNLSGITFANSNSITFGLSTGAGVGTITASVSYPAAQTGLSGIQVSNTTYTSGTVTFQNANGISFGSSGANGISASYTVPTQTNQTIGIYGSSQTVGSASSSTYDARSLSIIGAGIISIGNASTSAGGTTTGIIISASQSVQPVAISGSNGSFTFSTLTAGNLNGLSFYTSNGSVVGSYTVPTVPALSIGVSTGGNTLGNTGIYSGQAVFAGGNNITLSVSTAAGGAQTITISGANAGGAQTGISGVQVSNTTYTSGTITFQNANGISFGSSGANGISASYTVPTQTAQTVGVYASSQTTGSASSSTYDARSLSIIGAGIISIGNASTSAGGTTTGIIISASQSIQPVAVSGSNGSFAFSTLTIGNLNGASFYTSNGSVVASYTVPTVPVLSVGVSTGGNTLGNTGTYSGQAVFAGGNNITLSVSTAAGGAQTITISGANIGGAQTGISGLQVSNTTYTSGTVTFQNANGISFGSSGANGISASYTVPTQTAQTLGVYASSQTIGSASSSTYDARSLSIIGAGIISIGNASTSAGGTTTGIIISASQSVQPVAISGSNGSFAFSTVTFGNLNGASFYTSNGSVVASYTVPTQTVQTVGVYASSQTTGSASSSTYDARSLSIIGAGIISIGNASTSAGGTTTGIIISASQSNQAFSAQGGSSAFQTLVFTNSNNVSFSNTNGSVWGSYALNVSAAGGTSNALSGLTFSNGSGVSFGLSTGVGIGTLTASVAAQSAQTGISGIQVSNTTYTSGTITFQNANGISFGSSGANGISASYTVPTQTVQTVGVYASSQTTGSASSFTYDARSLSIIGAGIISIGNASTSAGGTTTGIIISASQSIQPVAVSGSNGSFAFSTATFGNLNGLSFYTSNGSVVGSYTVPAVPTLSVGVSTGGATSGNTGIYSGQVVFAGTNLTLSVSSGAAGAQTITVSAPAISSLSATGAVSISINASTISIGAPVLSVGVSTGGNTLGNTGIYSGQAVFAGGNNITLSVSTAAGGAQTITISGANAGGAQTAISGIQVSNTTYTSGTVTFQNANGISFGSSGANGISASYTVPTQSVQSIGIYASSQTTGSASSATYDARSITVVGAGIISVGNASTSAGGTTTGLFISATQSNQAVSAQGGSSAFQTLVFTNSNNVSFSNTNGSVWGSYALNVSAGGGTSNALSGLTFSNGSGVSFGLSTGAGVGTLTASVAAQSAQTGISGVQVSNTTYTSGTVTFQNANGISFGSSGANGISASYTVPTVPVLSAGVTNIGNTLGNTGTQSGQLIFAGGNNITLSVSTAAGGAQTITISGANVGGAQTGISGIVVSNTTYTSGTVTFQNANGISFGSSGANGISASYTVPTVPVLSAGVTNIGNTLGNTGTYSGQVVFAGGNNITLSVSSGAVGAQTITIVGGAGGGGVALNDGANTISTGTALLSGVNMTFSINGQTVSASVPATSSLLGTGAVSIVVNANTISIGAPVQSYPIGSRYEPELFGNAAFVTIPNGTLIVRPFELDIDYDVNKIGLLHSFISSAITMSLTASISGGNASSGTGTWGFSGTQIFFSRVQTNVTAASYNSIISAYSNTFTSSAGYSASVSWSTNASSMTASWTTSAAVGFVSNINSNGSFTTGSVTSSGSSTFSATSTAAHTTGTTVTMSFLYANFSGPRNVYIPNYALSTNNVPPGEYWLGLIQSTTTGTTNFGSLSQVVHLSDAGKLFYTAVTNSYMEIGNSVAFSNSGEWMIFGSYGTSANTTTAIPLTNFTTMASNASLWFALDNRTQ